MKDRLKALASHAIAWLISCLIVVPMLTAMALYAIYLAAMRSLVGDGKDG